MKKITLIICFLINCNTIKAETSVVEINDILKNLRCLVCQGQSVADSNSDFAQTIKLVVADQITDGKSESEIYDFLKDKYGDWILYKPAFNRLNSILWLLPYFAFFIGGMLIFLMFKKRDYH
tara:strand:+ start:330 stop:695 length:366 start_codon:yes stop_codon:yes gene_type:complete